MLSHPDYTHYIETLSKVVFGLYSTARKGGDSIEDVGNVVNSLHECAQSTAEFKIGLVFPSVQRDRNRTLLGLYVALTTMNELGKYCDLMYLNNN